MTSPSDVDPARMLKRWHGCQAPGCHRRIREFYFACGQHRALLGYELSCALQTAWLERGWRPAEEFEARKREALARWGWKDTPCPA